MACGDGRAAAPLLPLFPLLPVFDEPELPDVDAGAEGVKTALGFDRQELAAALAFWTEEGALAFTVAFPPKSHEVEARFVIS